MCPKNVSYCSTQQYFIYLWYVVNHYHETKSVCEYSSFLKNNRKIGQHFQENFTFPSGKSADFLQEKSKIEQTLFYSCKLKTLHGPDYPLSLLASTFYTDAQSIILYGLSPNLSFWGFLEILFAAKLSLFPDWVTYVKCFS